MKPFLSVFKSRFRDDRQFRLFLLLALASGLDIFLILGRAFLTKLRWPDGLLYFQTEIGGFFGLGFGFLIWNLFLAWVPYLAALRLDRAERQGKADLQLYSWFAVWLLFLPNAPYIITDFIHLEYRPPVPIWYDLILLFAFASTGLWVGILSLLEVRNTIRRRFSGIITEVVVLSAIGLSGFGVWLGRFQRWNSWDVLTNPKGLARDLAYLLVERHEFIKALGISGLIAMLVLIGYGMARVMLAGKR